MHGLFATMTLGGNEIHRLSDGAIGFRRVRARRLRRIAIRRARRYVCQLVARFVVWNNAPIRIQPFVINQAG